MRAYKIELLVIADNDDILEETLDQLHLASNPFMVKKVELREIGKWTIDHPLNIVGIGDQVYFDLFR